MTDNLLSKQLDALLFNEHNPVSNLANASALLYSSLKDINWAGFYLYDEQTDLLDLGPFQGKVACMHIKNGTGVGVLDIDSPSKNRFSKEDEKELSEFVEVLLKNTKWS